LGRTAIQKVVYFLQVLDVPMRYRFDVYHYGPFCHTIIDDTEWLLADDVIAEGSPSPKKYSKFIPGQACDELLQKHSEKLKAYDAAIESAAKALLPLQPEHLELIATLDYAFREVQATLGKKPPREKVIGRFREFKGEQFQAKDIEATFDQLESAGLFA